ncbi:MAG: PepSY domain-containing protein [Sphingomonas taxi]|uniref:PepSY domain-containing protein n=1 Tax=Sphingomonas taxi TaxID=1549858 RepID=A0A2W5PEU1_9SPHN|nr:MAG: PepSY domain-containing protein [Sphingomonas taxi]
MRTDIIKTYKDIHSWVGIVAGLALFVAFYAGAITMFEEPLNRWASAPTPIAAPPSLQRTPELVDKLLRAHPEARAAYTVHWETGPDTPARVSWTTGTRRAPGPTWLAALAPDGSLQVVQQRPSPVAQLVDVLHQQVGLPFPHEVAMPIMGVIALLYAVAIVSGVICLLPSLVKDLFALRFGRNVKRMWLDLHNVLGLFSLPFHIVMAVTAVIFAFHDQIYAAQGAVQQIGAAKVERRAPPRDRPAPPPLAAVTGTLSPLALQQRIAQQVPGFRIRAVSYEYNRKEGAHASFIGNDPRYGARAPTYGMGEVDTRTGAITEADYLPGRQGGWFATVTSFFTLHFGSFGGAPVRWSYFFLGLAGAFLFYSGNLLWIESRRRKERKAGAVEQTRATRILGALTVGVPLGCVAGISVTIAAAKWLPPALPDLAAWHSRIYYAVFVAMVAWALARGAARSGTSLLWVAAATTAAIPLTSLTSALSGTGWSHDGATRLVDLTAAAAAMAFAVAAQSAWRRARHGPRDSVWSMARPAAT